MPTCKQCGINPTSGDFCSQCVDQMNEDKAMIDYFISQGHSRHCACGQVWGHGECSCHLEKIYDPYWWEKQYRRVPFTTA
jgi:hypothetical protein